MQGFQVLWKLCYPYRWPLATSSNCPELSHIRCAKTHLASCYFCCGPVRFKKLSSICLPLCDHSLPGDCRYNSRTRALLYLLPSGIDISRLLHQSFLRTSLQLVSVCSGLCLVKAVVAVDVAEFKQTSCGDRPDIDVS